MTEETNIWNSIENKWLNFWEKNSINESDPNIEQNKYFITVAYPYPNSPQHIGHGRTYTIADTHARYKRQRGYNVLFPMAFHYTGTPILGMSKRVLAGDKEIIDNFKNIYKIDDKDIETFKDPLQIAKYFHSEIRSGMIEMGYSIDWRREFTTIDPIYKKFISWQFETLKNLGVIEQGSHPVGWCPNDGNPVSQHDTLGDVEPAFTEYTLIKFRLSDDKVYLPTATMRPETLFGVTNLWINPAFKYLLVRIDKEENWIITEEAYKKIIHLNYAVEIIREVEGKDYVGLFVENPINNVKIPIFPADFVTADEGSGIVMSVPAHAPFDMQALLDLKKREAGNPGSKVLLQDVRPVIIINSKVDEELETNGLKSESQNNGTDIIETDDENSKLPSMILLQKYSIKEQNDSNLEKATSELYSLEFYSGTMNDTTLLYSGLPVSEAREKIKFELLQTKNAIPFYELTNKPVICRCGTKCYVKLLENQWFLNYGNAEWKKTAFECLNSMQIIPDDIIREFMNVFDWLKVRACARKTGLGTPLPWDEDWIIESLSDSVIYMAYYIIAKYVNQHDLGKYIDFIDNNFFNYILLGKGDINYSIQPDKSNEKTSDKSTLNKTDGKDPNFIAVTNSIRDEFRYYYPLDSRHSGRDLVPNHLSFFIFNHSIIFPKSQWPKQIVVNGSVLMDGKKMSKSMGNIIPLRDTIRQFNADSIRVAMLILGELLQDVDFSFTTLRGIHSKLNEIFRFSKDFLEKNESMKDLITYENYSNLDSNNLNLEDIWILHRLNVIITEVSKALDELRIRDSLNTILYLMDRDYEWYKKRKFSKLGSNKDSERVFDEITFLFIKIRVLLISPFCPFLSEELWTQIGNKDKTIFAGNWPKPNDAFVNITSLENEAQIINLIQDLNKILKVTKNRNPKKIYIYLSSKIKGTLYKRIIGIAQTTKSRNFGLIMKMLLSDNSMNIDEKKFIQQNTDLVKKINEDLVSLSPNEIINRESSDLYDESIPIMDARSLISKEFGITEQDIQVFFEDDPKIVDPKNKARFSRPYKPAIYVE